MKINVFVIGYKNHALKIISILSNISDIEKIVVYHPDMDSREAPKMDKNIIFTDNFLLILDAKCVFIASPSETHYFYLKKIRDLYQNIRDVPYIYCEKPIVTSQLELDWLSSNILFYKNRLMCGYNLRFLEFSTETQKLLINNKFGKPVFANFQVTHGIAFKNSMRNNWRFTSDNAFSNIVGNLGTHYVNLSMHFFGKIIKSNLNIGQFSNQKRADTAVISIQHGSGVISTIILSYASVFSKRLEVFFTDGSINSDGKELFSKHPRDTFNADGEFKSPEAQLIKALPVNRDDSLEKSLKYFLKVASINSSFNFKDLSNALDSTREILTFQ